jgi:hypothetical protein
MLALPRDTSKARRIFSSRAGPRINTGRGDLDAFSRTKTTAAPHRGFSK